jgi:hypothetical protein
MDRLEGTDGHMDEATKWVRVDVLDFFGNLDPYTFQDWITALEDCQTEGVFCKDENEGTSARVVAECGGTTS